MLYLQLLHRRTLYCSMLCLCQVPLHAGSTQQVSVMYINYYLMCLNREEQQYKKLMAKKIKGAKSTLAGHAGT